MSNKTRTEMQVAFISHMVRGGCGQTEAARRAGYNDPSSRAYELVRNPRVMEAIRDEQCRLIDGDLANVALSTLDQVMRNEDYPASARVSAAKTVLEMGGYAKRADLATAQERSLADMSIEELEVLVMQGREALAMDAQQITYNPDEIGPN